MGMNFGLMIKMKLKKNKVLIVFVLFFLLFLGWSINLAFESGYKKGMMDICDYYKGDLIEYSSNLKPDKFICSNMSWYEEDSFFMENIYTNWSYE